MSDLCRTYIHPEGAAPMRADKALAVFFKDEVSRSRLLESFKEGKVRINGEPIIKKYELHAGDAS